MVPHRVAGVELVVGDWLQVSRNHYEPIVALARDDIHGRVSVRFENGSTSTYGFRTRLTVDTDAHG